MIVRFTLSCCVADARAIGLVVINAGDEAFDQDAWVQVRGHLEIREIDGIETPVIIADDITPTDEPEQPYLFF